MKRIDGNTRVIVLVIVIIVIILGGVGYFAWTKLAPSKSATNTQTTEVAVDPATQVPPAAADTKTYSNSTYSFDYLATGWTTSEVKYGTTNPATTVVRTSDYKQTGMGLDNGAEVAVNVTPTTKTLSQLKQDVINFGDGTQSQNVLDIKIGGKDAFSYYSAYEGIRYHTVIVNNGSSYDIVYQYGTKLDVNKYKNGYDVITSTFTLK